MKQIYFIFILLVNSSFAQTIKVVYSETRILGDEAKQFFSEREQRLKVMPKDFELLFSENKSIYKKCNYTIDNDSVKYPKTNGIEDFSQPYVVKDILLEQIYFKDFAKDSLVYFTPNTEKNYYLKDKLLNWDWEITTETQAIHGYKCTKAVSKKFGNVVAWFTSEIQNHSGPAIYHGLPGMILKIERSFITIELKSIAFLNTSNIILAPKTNEKTYTLLQYQTLMQERMNERQSNSNTFIIKN